MKIGDLVKHVTTQEAYLVVGVRPAGSPANSFIPKAPHNAYHIRVLTKTGPAWCSAVQMEIINA